MTLMKPLVHPILLTNCLLSATYNSNFHPSIGSCSSSFDM